MINQLDLVQKNDGKNLLVSQPESKKQKGKNRTNELRKNSTSGNANKRGTGNTTPKPVGAKNTDNVTAKHPTSIFVDYLKFFGEGMRGISERHEKMLVQLFLELDFFRTIECQKNVLEPMKVQVIECKKSTRPGSGRNWNYYYQNSIGVKLYISRNIFNPNQVESLCLEFSGSPLAILIPRNNLLKLAEMIEFVTSLNKKIRVTRIDTTLEFDHSLLDYKEIIIAVNNKNFSGVKKAKVIYEVDVETGIQYPTIYLGKPRSRKITRIYETTEKHGYTAIRIETQNKDRYAQFVAKEIVNLYKSAIENHCMDAKGISDFIRDYVLSIKNFNFVFSDSKKAYKTASQYKELPFWTKFKEDMKVEELTYIFPKRESNIQRTMDWIIKQVSGKLNLFIKAFGKEYAHELIDAFADINKMKYENEGGLNQLARQELGQIKDMGFKAHVEMFSPQARKQLQKVGFYNKQTRPKYWRVNSVIDYLDLAVKPAYHWEYNSF